MNDNEHTEYLMKLNAKHLAWADDLSERSKKLKGRKRDASLIAADHHTAAARHYRLAAQAKRNSEEYHRHTELGDGHADDADHTLEQDGLRQPLDRYRTNESSTGVVDGWYWPVGAPTLRYMNESLTEAEKPTATDWENTKHARVSVSYTPSGETQPKTVVARFAAPMHTPIMARGKPGRPRPQHLMPTEYEKRVRSSYEKRGHTVHAVKFERYHEPPEQKDPTKGTATPPTNQAKRISSFLSQKWIGPRSK